MIITGFNTYIQVLCGDEWITMKGQKYCSFNGGLNICDVDTYYLISSDCLAQSDLLNTFKQDNVVHVRIVSDDGEDKAAYTHLHMLGRVIKHHMKADMDDVLYGEFKIEGVRIK